jgi:predicted DsbA family dithiol-disulfide isomerase
MPIPKRYPGLRFGPDNAFIRLELFADPLCSDCAVIWPSIQAILSRYPTQLSLNVHFLPLPYHTWAYVITRSILAVSLTSAAKAQQFLINLFTGDYDKFSNSSFANESQNSVLSIIAAYILETLGIPTADFTTNYNLPSTDEAGRIEFKFSAGRGVNGTPVVYINGMETTLNEATPLSQWNQIIDELIG